MKKFKVKSSEDDKNFVSTNSFKGLYKALKDFKNCKGRFIHVLGAPGTGKSSNIYHALNSIGLKFYDMTLLLDNTEMSSKEVFNQVFNSMKEDVNIETREELYEEASKYDVILFTDKFLDSHFLDQHKVGLSRWIENRGFKSLPLYIRFIIEYFKHKQDLKKINIILQHSWILKINGVKFDLFVDFGILSKIFKSILKLFFEVVEISYSESEVIKIVKSHMKDIDEKQIELYVQKYGHKPRFILNAMESKSLTIKLPKSNLRTKKSYT